MTLEDFLALEKIVVDWWRSNHNLPFQDPRVPLAGGMSDILIQVELGLHQFENEAKFTCLRHGKIAILEDFVI